MKKKEKEIAESTLFGGLEFRELNRDSSFCKSKKKQKLLKDLCEAPENSPASWCKKSGEASSSGKADFLLEAEKRDSPPKSEKAAAFWEHNKKELVGAGRGVQPFLRKESSELSGEGFAESRLDSALKAEFVAESRNEKKGKTGFKRIKNAFFYSLSGLKSAFCEEEAFRQIIIVSVILIPLGAYLGESFAEKVLLILPCVLAILAELANSAIENAIDFAGLEIHPFAKKAKDMGSAMQFIACLFMGGVWIFYLIQRLLV